MVRALVRLGCEVVRQRGSHVILRCGSCRRQYRFTPVETSPEGPWGSSVVAWSRASGWSRFVRPSAREVTLTQDEDGAWIATVASLPGCHSYGWDVAEAEANVREATAAWLDLETSEVEIVAHLVPDGPGASAAAGA